MYSNFEKLADDKKKRILTICIEEFADTGYEKTSTDTITARAGISKGILYHYFKNKKNLFIYVVDYCRKLIGDNIMAELQHVESEDFFNRVKEVVLIKKRVQFHYLKETELVTQTLLNPPQGMEEEIRSMLQKNIDVYSDQYLEKLIDRSLLKENATPDKVINLTMTILDQIAQKNLKAYQEKAMSFSEILEKIEPELDEYIDIIKYGALKRV
ncbi:TetR/AcrR family transcriptional regulator [Alkalihalobacillus sp. CinArs1]|uniref:TetR/AcrR family transcriptional regulator n=1 Tax=Alkalihalobacillus sp. CinArs1 TaxID=2995314 RepID=UPI0022DD01ED|nr:TetR/AcrR family transcriptional regulator [Alkalihalobacillus sp. CinArs1]